ncbi:MAG: hypothetical protein MRK01_06180 [Candidatus Scalindua sp.]|nr:hypothetical protein [Candidatus Scalindua sp.]
MNDKKFSKFIGFVCAFIMVITSHSSYTLSDRLMVAFSSSGYRPVEEAVNPVANGEKVNDNILYKKWCEKMFENGSCIYQAYKDIAFNIEYTAEENNADFWQSPDETERLKKGDCEDAVFLFYSHLSRDQNNAEIVWGWVIDKESEVRRPHVWYQLTDRNGKQWVVEGFSRRWNGIIPMKEIEKTELRRVIFTLPHLAVSSFAGSPKRVNKSESLSSFGSVALLNHDSTNRSTTQDYAGLSSPDSNREITNILNKLHELFSRYKVPQKVIALKELQEKKLICRR